MTGNTNIDNLNLIFRAYDIRGVYNKQIDNGLVNNIGKAFGTFMGHDKKIVVGRDVRESSKNIEPFLADGLLDTGVSIIQVGVVPTPVVYFAVNHYDLDGGVIVGASHNPAEWVGFKLCGKQARTFGIGLGLEEIRDLAKTKKFKYYKRGTTTDNRSTVLKDYENYLLKKIKIEKEISIGVDPGNGACSIIAAEILKKANLRTKTINDNPDGTFPARSPEPKDATITGLKNLVKEKGLDLGVAYDGDGDRVLFVDENGEVLRGDIPVALFTKNYLEKGESVVYEASCSSIIEEEAKAKGATPIMTKVGHTYIADAMINNGSKFGGEISGHLFFKEMYGREDTIFATLKIAELMSRRGKKLSELVNELPKREMKAEEFDVSDETKFMVIETLKNKFVEENYKTITIDGVKVFTNEGWFIIRASNTTPKVRIVAEAKNKNDLNKLLDFAKEELHKAETEK